MSSTDPTSGNGRHPLDLLAEEFMERRRRGERPSLEEYAERYPELADEIRKAFPAIIMMERLKSAAGDSTLGLPDEPETGPDPLAAAAGCLGDFRIVREIGRGGMGVVYEARQISLKRTVAIKVLRFGAVADEAALMRFHREAETVAQMHHTNIVPIYAVGDEGGVHYFAMQLIEGRSLSELFAESRAQGKGLAPNDVADWGRQAAEALDYAHRRGVVHRDIKPSNLLLDANGIIWLTDFGLAKRGDEASLTVSGTLMGTPRYMSPEQAESLTRPVDHRTDVYSLGASLYELATGKPLFESATAHDVIAKILHDEPVLPRKVRPSLPRDLETVILTCLAKDPARRYPTAQAVADDLRAVLDARPIRARRARLPERALRYVRTRRREIAVTAKAVVISMILLAASLLAWRLHDQANQGGLTLDTDGPALLAEILPPDRDEPVIDEFTAPNRIPAALSEGSYRVRLSAPGQLSETYQLFVDRWQSRTFTVRLDDRRLWGPADRPASPVAEPVNLSGHDDLIEWDGDTLRRRDGKDGKVIWDLARGERPGWPTGREFDRWMKHLGGGGPRDIPAGLARPAPDLDGDGTRDLIFALKAAPAMLAVSGKDGALLWASPNTGPEANRPGSVAGQPVATDVDGDGTPDLIAVFSHDATDPTAPGRRVVAVSGKSGRWLWDHELGADALRSDIMPIRLDGRPVLAVVHGRRWLGLDPVTGRARAGPLELPAAPGRAPQYADLDGDGRPEVIAVAAGDSPGEESLSVSSIATGQPLWTTTIRARSRFEPDPWHAPAACPLIADLDGDGRPEVVVPAMRRDAGRTIGLRVLEGATGRQRWYRDLNIAAGGLKADRFLDGPDLDGDGCREIFMVSLESRGVPYPSRGKDRAFAFRVYADALSGKDGRPLWWWKDDFECPENYPSLDPLRWWGTGPDGWPQLLVSYGQLSSPLSRLPHAVRGGGPPLLVSYHEYWHPHTLSVLAAGTGRATQTLRGISRPGLADFDGDGLADLWGVVAGRFQAFRGTPPVAWRTLGDCKPARDFDGDAIRDVLHLDTKSRVARALSGRDGRLLWRADLSGGYSLAADYPDIFYGATTFPNPAGDLDGDGTSDVLASMLRAASRFAPDHLPLVAISGRTGERLWTAGAVPADAEGPTIRDLWGLDCRDLGDARGKALIALICTRRDVDVISAPFWWQLQLCRISARDGSIDWIRPLTERVSTVFQRSYGRAYVGTKDHLDAPDVAVAIPAGTGARSWAWEIVDSGQTFPHDFVDLDGDGIPELLLAVPVPADANAFAFELRAVSLGGGRMLWHRFLRRRHGGREYPPAPIFAAGDLDGDSKGEVVVVDVPAQGPGIEVTALDGRDGKPRWTWTGGDDGDWAKPESIPLRLVDLDGQGHRSVCLTVARNQLVLLDDRGRVRERRPAVVAKGAQSLEPGIRAPDGLPLPLSLSSQDDATVCRLALTTPSGRPGWSRSPEDDPRPKVPLPGANLIAPLLDPLLAIIATALNLALIVVPGVLIRLARRRRRWTLASLLTLPLVAAVVLASYRLMTFYLSDNLTMPEFFIFLGVSSVLGSFVVAFIRQLGSSLIRERWWAFGLTLGIPLALGLLGSRVGTANLDSSLHDRWEKWYCVALATIYIVGFLIVAWWSMRTVGSGLGRVIRVFRLRCRPTRHLEAASEAVTS